MSDTIFTQIIRGDIPSHKVYEDDQTFVFLDINPIREGHLLVVPKNPVPYLWDLPDDDYHAVMATAKQMAVRLRETLGAKNVEARVIGEQVPHAHVHLIPYNEASELDVPHPEQADNETLARLAKALAI